MDLKAKIQELFLENIATEGKLPAGVRIPERDFDAIDSKPLPSFIQRPVNKEVRKLNDIEPLIKNIDTNMLRLQQGVIDVKRILKDVDSKSGSNNLEKFNVDYDKLTTEVKDIKAEVVANPSSIEVYSKIKSLSNKIAVSFGNVFYKIKKAIPGQLNGNVWTFSDEPTEPTKPIEAPKAQSIMPPLTPAPTPVKPLEPMKPIEAPKAHEDLETKLSSQGYGDEDDMDAELGLSTKDRHSDEDDLDEGQYGNIRETIKNCFKL